MKLLSLQAADLRGLRDVAIAPGGSNFLVWGTNGTGKSSIVDALEFLLAGTISRLTGTGTRSMSLRRHGPHIDSGSTNARVEGRFRFRDGCELTLRRRVGQADKLEIEGEPTATAQASLEVAQRGEHTLARRNILRFVTSDAGTRADEVQQVLDLEGIETVRRSVVKARNNLKRDFGAAKGQVSDARATLAAALQVAEASEATILEQVNAHRKTLGGAALEKVSSTNIKQDLSPPSSSPERPALNRQSLLADLEHLGSPLADGARACCSKL